MEEAEASDGEVGGVEDASLEAGVVVPASTSDGIEEKNMPDLGPFGWTQLFTAIGLIMTGCVSIVGLRTFGKWKKEKLEERRIDIAFDVLSIAHESKFVFGRIRDPNGFEGEWRNMPMKEGESEEDRTRRGGSFATLIRLRSHADYFEKVSRLQPKAIAVFGEVVETAFERLNQAETLVRDAAIQLTWQLPVRPEKPSKEDFENRMRLRGHLWAGFQQPDRVEFELNAFRSQIENMFRPVIEQQFRSFRRTGGKDISTS